MKHLIFLNIQKGMQEINHSTKYLSHCMTIRRVGTANKLSLFGLLLNRLVSLIISNIITLRQIY